MSETRFCDDDTKSPPGTVSHCLHLVSGNSLRQWSNSYRNLLKAAPLRSFLLLKHPSSIYLLSASRTTPHRPTPFILYSEGSLFYVLVQVSSRFQLLHTYCFFFSLPQDYQTFLFFYFSSLYIFAPNKNPPFDTYGRKSSDFRPH